MIYNSVFRILYSFAVLTTVSANIVLGQITLKKVGKFNSGICYGLSLNKNNAYTTTNKSLIILDISNPEMPKKVGELEIGVPVFGLSVKNDHVFLAASDKGLFIVDISNPKKPNIVGEYSGSGTMIKVYVFNNLCYIIYQETGIE